VTAPVGLPGRADKTTICTSRQVSALTLEKIGAEAVLGGAVQVERLAPCQQRGAFRKSG